MPPPREAGTGLRSGPSIRALRAALWLLPVAFLFWLYRDGLSTWFLADDFAWLSLLGRLRTGHNLLHQLFTPMAQGTIRPWSERGFFLLLESLFGLDSLPFRIAAFSVAAADLLLIAWLTVRTTGSRVAGFVAPFLWAANTALVRGMTWSSAFNEVLCPLFLLGALAGFIRYVETERRIFWWWQLVVFSLGFGVLEINVVYPALAAAWVLFAGRSDSMRRNSALRSLIPLACVSIVYCAVHRLAAPLPVSGPYALRLDASVFKTLAIYWKWSLAPEPMTRFGYSHVAAGLFAIIGSLAIAAFTVRQLRGRHFAVLFFLAWFAITLAPVLPLLDHRTDYYLTIPVIGIAMLGGAAVGAYRNRPWIQRALPAIPVALYLWMMVPVTQAATHLWMLKSLSVRTLVLGVRAAHEAHPGKAIVVDGVTTELFDLSIADHPFTAIGVDDVYLTPESGLSIKSDQDSIDMETLIPDPAAIRRGITHDQVVIYSLESNRLRNITEGYARRLVSSGGSRTVDRLPARIDVGNTLYSWLLGPTWLLPESGVRWMPGRATLQLRIPAGGATRLALEGRCPKAQLLAAPPHLMVLIDGVVAGDTRIYDPETTFRRLFPVPAVLIAGKTSAEIEIRVAPVDRKDGQEYGLVFGKLAFLP